MKYLFLVITLPFFLYTNAQHNDSQAAVYNVLSSSIIGGIGAIINKSSDQKIGKVFIKGVYQGAIGGYVVFESKRVLREFTKTNNYGYIWPSKVLNSIGNSMVYNAASNRNLWERWHINIGFNHLEYDFKRDKKLRYRILPLSFSRTIQGFTKGTLDVQRSFASGHFIFKEKYSNQDYYGRAMANSVLYVDLLRGNSLTSILTHELIHSYQYEQSFVLNCYLDKPISKLEKRSSFVKNYNKIFYTDFNHILNSGIYGIHDIFDIERKNQYYENEADYFMR